MELKTWKQLPTDDFTCIDVPSRKMVEIMLLNSGRIIATVSGHNTFYWTVAIPDSRVEETITIIRDLRVKGMKFDGVENEPI